MNAIAHQHDAPRPVPVPEFLAWLGLGDVGVLMVMGLVEPAPSNPLGDWPVAGSESE